jgi:hypothetical protein
MMTYESLESFMATTHRYADVTAEEIAALTVSHYMTVFSGVTYIGSFDAADTIAAKELFPAPVVDTSQNTPTA